MLVFAISILVTQNLSGGMGLISANTKSNGNVAVAQADVVVNRA